MNSTDFVEYVLPILLCILPSCRRFDVCRAWRQLSIPLIGIARLKWNGGRPHMDSESSHSDSETEERSAKRIKVLKQSGSQWVSIDPDSEWFKYSMDTLKCVSSFSHIRALSVKGSYLVDIGPLKHLPHLRTLNMSNNPVTSLEPLRDIRALRVLNMYNTAVKTLEPLRNNSDLELLDISGTPIDSLTTLHHFPNLRILFCVECIRIPSLDGVNFATKLQVLDMTDTDVKLSLSPIGTLAELQVLICIRCRQLRSASSLLSCNALKAVDVRYTYNKELWEMMRGKIQTHLNPMYGPAKLWADAQNAIEPAINNASGFGYV